MGLNIREIISRKELYTEKLRGKIVCVDAFNILYQFLSTVRQLDGTPLMDSQKRVTSHLSGILYRNVALMEEGIKLIYVFDGKPPELKSKIHEKRGNFREIAREKYEKAKQEEDFGSMRRYGSQLIRLDDDMIKESKELLGAMGILVVQAPGEGEAECAYLSRTNEKIYGAVSQDYDSLLFGAPYLIRNLTVSKRKKTPVGYLEVHPEIIDLKEALKEMEITRDQLICLGILVGTDYNPKGVPGIGQKKALELVKKLKEPNEIFDSVKEKIDELSEEDKFDWKEIFELFKNPDSKEIKLEFPKINPDKIKKLLVEEHEFSSDRVDRQIERLNEIEKTKQQKSLDNWF